MSAETKKLIADILGYIITLICLLSPQLKRKWQMLSMTFLANVLSGFNFLLLGQVSAVGVSAVCIVQAALSIRRSKEENKKTPLYEVILFGLLYIVGGLLPFIVSGTLDQFRVLDAVPIFGALLLCVSMAMTNEQHMRLFSLANASVFTVYDIIIKSTQVFAQIITILSVSIALLRYRKKEKSVSVAEDQTE